VAEADDGGIINAPMNLATGECAMLNVRLAIAEAALFAWRAPHLGKARDARPFLFALALLCSITPANAEYKLHVGDVIEISVVRLPELKQRVPIQMDGTISFPLLGTLPVAGLSPAEVQAKVQAMLAAKVFPQRTSDGRETSVTIEPDEVTATVAEYRPIYVNGDVSKPGEQAYRPLMTVRQALALSGGYDVVRLRMNNPILESADLQAEYESLWTEYAKEQAHVWRLQQELGQQTTIDQKALLDVPLARPAAQAIVNTEAEQLKARKTDEEGERAFLQHGIVQADEEIQVLSQQQKTEEQGNQADIDEFERTKDLFSRGNLTSLRVSDARRAMLLSSIQKLQTAAQLMQTKRQRDDLSRQIVRLDGQRRSDMLRELQDATVAVSKIRFKLQSTGEKLQYTVLAKSQLARGPGNRPAITVMRNATKGIEKLTANEDFELQPGDVVEVALMKDTTGATLSDQEN
jgi:polysaccharide biosynthesis/export protein